jgi:hypothetical protein
VGNPAFGYNEMTDGLTRVSRMGSARSLKAGLFALCILAGGAVGPGFSQQGTTVDFDKLLATADALLEEAKKAYEEAREKSYVAGFVDAGFKLEECRIKFIVIQEIGPADKQKAAADRLRSVNQLGKLIHDGKVAISGAPANAPVPAPDTPAPDKPATPAPSPVAVVKAAADVTKRLPVPDPANQKDSEKLIHDLFKELYSKKSPADRNALGKALLEQAAKSQDDPPGLWVLCREAQDVGVQLCDPKIFIPAVDAVVSNFDVDGLSMKVAALTNAGKNAKTPDEFASLAETYPALIRELTAADQFEGADRAATAALLAARKSNSAFLVARATVQAKEIAESKTLYVSFKSVLEVLAKAPEDSNANLEMGKFLCFVKNNWGPGLRFMLKGSDATLKKLAEREALLPTQVEELVGLGDAWFELAEKDKSFLRKARITGHAASIYNEALPNATALLKAKIEKKLESLQGTGVAPVAPFIDVTTLTPKKSKVGTSTLGVNTNLVDKKTWTVVVNGKECNQYIFAHAPSSVVYAIPPGTRTFTAVGVKLENASWIPGTWKYVVIVDGKSLYVSKPLAEVKGFELEISVPIPAGAKEVELKIDEIDDLKADWSVWAYPRFVK